MKAQILTLFSLSVLALSSCHYGADAVKEDVERNKEYQSKRAEREAATALPEDAAAKMNGETGTAATDTTNTDTTRTP